MSWLYTVSLLAECVSSYRWHVERGTNEGTAFFCEKAPIL